MLAGIEDDAKTMQEQVEHYEKLEAAANPSPMRVFVERAQWTLTSRRCCEMTWGYLRDGTVALCQYCCETSVNAVKCFAKHAWRPLCYAFVIFIAARAIIEYGPLVLAEQRLLTIYENT